MPADDAPVFCPSCGAPRTWDHLNGSIAYYCACPGVGAGAPEVGIADVRAALPGGETCIDEEAMAFLTAEGKNMGQEEP